MNVKSIDFESGKFESCGVMYYIDVDGMCYERMKKFLELIPYVSIGRSSMDLMLFIKSCFDKLTSGGDDFKKSYFEVAELMKNMLMTADESNDYKFLNKNLDFILEFCALFVNTDNEDKTVINKSHNQRKIENWKKDMVMEDFFFLAKKRIPYLQQTLKEIHEQMTKNQERT